MHYGVSFLFNQKIMKWKKKLNSGHNLAFVSIPYIVPHTALKVRVYSASPRTLSGKYTRFCLDFPHHLTQRYNSFRAKSQLTSFNTASVAYIIVLAAISLTAFFLIDVLKCFDSLEKKLNGTKKRLNRPVHNESLQLLCYLSHESPET